MGDKVASSPVVMSASVTNSPSVQAVPLKKATTPKTKKPRAKPMHPRTAEMVNAAITNLKERSGSSLQAIKKYVLTTYKIDVEKHAPFIKRYLKTAVASGALVQTKGKGATGSFKLSSAKPEAVKSRAQRAASRVAVTKKAVVAPKKAAPAKKQSASKKPAAKKAAIVTASEKRKVTKGPAAKPPKAKTSSSRTKRVAKAPVRKPKAAQPKKVVETTKTKKAAPKKAVVPKKK